MKGAIVTGANGFIGSHVVRQLLQQGIRVVALCHDGKCDNLPHSDLLTVYPFDLEYVQDFAKTCPPPRRHLLRSILSLCLERCGRCGTDKYCLAVG